MVRPVMPLVEYYLNYDYISQELCENKDKPYLECNGYCYVEKQLKKIDPIQQDQKPITSSTISLKDYPISTLDFCKINIINQKIEVENKNPLYYPFFTPKDIVVDLLQPPKIVV